MSYTITLDPYTILNFVNAVITTIVIIGCVIWLARFAASAVKFRDKIGMFLVTLAGLLLIANAMALMVQLGQALGLTEYRLTFTGFRFVERVLSLAGMIMLFVFGKQHYE